MWESELAKQTEGLPLCGQQRASTGLFGSWSNPMGVFCLVFMVFKSRETECKHGDFFFNLKIASLSPLGHHCVCSPLCANNQLGLNFSAASIGGTQPPIHPQTRRTLCHLSPSLYCSLFHDREIILYNEVFVKTKTKSVFLTYTWRTYLYCLGTT